MWYVVGIDQSVRHSGLCILNETTEIAKLLLIEPHKELSGGPLLAYTRDALTEALTGLSIKAAVMEGYSYGSANKKFLLGEVGGAVKLTIHDLGCPLYVAAPKQLKKFVTGRGDADKGRVMSAIEAQWGEKFSDDNLADAYGLSRIAHEIVTPKSTKRHQLEVAKIITKKDLNIKTPKGINFASDAL